MLDVAWDSSAVWASAGALPKDARSLDFSPSACSNEPLIDNRLSVSGTRLALDALIGVSVERLSTVSPEAEE